MENQFIREDWEREGLKDYVFLMESDMEIEGEYKNWIGRKVIVKGENIKPIENGTISGESVERREEENLPF